MRGGDGRQARPATAVSLNGSADAISDPILLSTTRSSMLYARGLQDGSCEPYRATANEASTDLQKVNEASTDAKKANATRNSSSSTPRPKDVLASGTSIVCWSTRADETHRNPCGFLPVPAVSVDQSTCYPKSAMPSWSLTSYVSNIIALPKPFLLPDLVIFRYSSVSQYWDVGNPDRCW